MGTRSWRAAQKARFDQQGGTPTNPNAQAISLLDYSVKHSLISDEERAQLGVTTLTRFLSNPVFRNVLGLANAKDVTILVPPEEFNRAVEKFLRDALEGKGSWSPRAPASRSRRTTAESSKNRVQRPPAAQDGQVNVNAKPSAAQPLDARAPQATVAPRRDNRSPDHRSTVIPSTFKAKITDKVLKRLYDELKTLDSSYSFACAYLLRAVIEQTAKLFLKKRGKAYDADLHVLIGRVADELQADGLSAKEVKGFRVMANDRDSRASPETLGTFVHGGQIPTAVELARAWDNVESNMARLFAEIG